MKKNIILLISIVCFPFISMAQYRGSGALASGRVYGKVIDGATQKGVGFASVTILKTADSSIASGVLTKENGDFEIEDLKPGKYIFKVNFIGYSPLYKNFSLSPKESNKDLGNFVMKTSTAQLATVDVTAQKSAYTMSLDKKVFDVTKSLTSVGGTAEDVLKEVPSVMVDIDGNVTLRNGSPTIYVDGKSSTLTLDQIPAESIEKIEVITNPSAKYSAEGMSGILNIVLKKNRKPGLNGQIMAGADTRGGYNGGVNLNVYRNPFNVSLSYFRHHRSRPSTSTTHKVNHFDSSVLDQNSDGKRYGDFQMGNLGVDYFLDNRNTFSVKGGFGGGSFNNKETLNSIYGNMKTSQDSSNIRRTSDKRNFNFYFGDFDYKHTFRKDGHELTGNIHYSKSIMTGDGNYETDIYGTDGNMKNYHLNQENYSDGGSTRFSGQADYVNPITDAIKLEAGIKYSSRTSNSTFDVYGPTENGKITESDLNTLLSSDYKYDEDTYAGYLQFSQQFEKFGYQLGLRAEQYSYSGAIPSKDTSFTPSSDDIGLFPSVYLTYKLTSSDQLQLNYSRRVNRPSFWQRIPYIDYSDPQNLRKGNPDLKPEFTNSFEFSYNKLFGQSNFLASLYFHNTNNEIMHYSEPYHGSRDTLISYSINANTNNSYGAEFTLQTQIANWWSITANFNLYQTEISATLHDKIGGQAHDVEKNAFSWFGKISTEAKLPANFTLQLSGRYSGPVPTPQGTSYRYGGMDFGIKKSLFKKKTGTLTLTLSDILNSNKSKYVYETEAFDQTRIRKRSSRYLGLTFTYRFGEQNLKLFRRKSNKSSQGSSDMQQMGGGQDY